ncbi:MAG: hypothetical protein DRQ37_08185 [Gammaproteobacteria bacterium]|nr:MAG: hypothetical protein DRQ37_08185 [Gammaproteobacteria bacterium]
METESTTSTAPSAFQSIDSEHRIQVGLLTALRQSINGGDPGEKVHEILDQLISYTELHFMSEQLLMRLYSYPEYDDHVRDHELMTEQVGQIKENYEAGEQSLSVDVVDTMTEFLLGHIKGRDHALGKYLSEEIQQPG